MCASEYFILIVAHWSHLVGMAGLAVSKRWCHSDLVENSTPLLQ